MHCCNIRRHRNCCHDAHSSSFQNDPMPQSMTWCSHLPCLTTMMPESPTFAICRALSSPSNTATTLHGPSSAEAKARQQNTGSCTSCRWAPHLHPGYFTQDRYRPSRHRQEQEEQTPDDVTPSLTTAPPSKKQTNTRKTAPPPWLVQA